MFQVRFEKGVWSKIGGFIQVLLCTSHIYSHQRRLLCRVKIQLSFGFFKSICISSKVWQRNFISKPSLIWASRRLGTDVFLKEAMEYIATLKMQVQTMQALADYYSNSNTYAAGSGFYKVEGKIHWRWLVSVNRSVESPAMIWRWIS